MLDRLLGRFECPGLIEHELLEQGVDCGYLVSGLNARKELDGVRSVPMRSDAERGVELLPERAHGVVDLDGIIHAFDASLVERIVRYLREFARIDYEVRCERMRLVVAV